MRFPESGPQVEGDVLIVNRIHPNEYLIGDQVDELFAEGPIVGVRLVTRNIPEDAREQRGLVPGSNTTFRQGRPDGDLDEQFLWEVTQAARGARVVIDVHAHRERGGNSYPFYGELSRHNPVVLGIASLLKSDGVLVQPASLYLPGSLTQYGGWDLAPDTDVQALRPILEELGAGWQPPVRPMKEYCYVATISAADAAAHGFEEEYGQFEPLPSAAIAKIGLPVGSCAIGWSAAAYALTGFWGDVAFPMPKEPAECR